MRLKKFLNLFLQVLALAVIAPLSVQANPSLTHDQVVKQVQIDQHLGEQIPMDLQFQNEKGETIQLGSLFSQKPVILIPVYYECPMLCSLVLNGLVKALKVITLSFGKDFDIITFSINPNEDYTLAEKKKARYLELLAEKEAAPFWHFLTAPKQAETIQALTQAIGFNFVYDPTSKEYAHAATLVVLTPEGIISHYFGGVEFSARDLRLALVEASQNEIGSFVDQILLLCYHYDPMTGKYGFAVHQSLRIAGIITVFIIVFFIGSSLKNERKKSKERV